MSAETGGSPEARPAGRIADLAYRGYDGPLRTRTARWWIVALGVIRQLRGGPSGRRYLFLMLTGLILIGYMSAGGILYANDHLVGAAAKGPAPENKFGLAFYHCLNFSNFILFLAALVAGAGSIADDNRSNALMLYLSKPITKTDYVLGKVAGVFAMLAVISWAPAFALYVFFAGAYWDSRFLQDDPALILRLTLATLAPALLHASLIVGISAWCRSGRAAGALYAGFFFLAGIVSSALGNLAADQFTPDAGVDSTVGGALLHSSVGGAVSGLGARLYGIAPDYLRANNDMPAPLFFIVALAVALVVLPVLAARLRIRAVEVVQG